MSIAIRRKSVAIAITNVCNLTCGGCCQLIGSFPKEKLFFASIEEIRSNIETAIRIARLDWDQPWFLPERRRIDIYGGEPTIHPDWRAIHELLQSEFGDYPFVVCTNGVTHQGRELPQTGDDRFGYLKAGTHIKAHDRNVYWRFDPKEASRQFLPTLLAPRDLIGDPDPSRYVAMARGECVHWTSHHCQTLIYRNRGYFCVNAGPFDWLFHNCEHGWPLDVDHPFDKAEEQVDEQALLFCQRCYHCLGENPPIHQSIHEKSLASSMNLVELRPGSFTEWRGQP